MKKILSMLAFAALFCFAGCNDDIDALEKEIDSLKSRLTALETQVDALNGNVDALAELSKKGATILSVEQASDGTYTITLSNGEVLTLAQGSEAEAVIPVIGIDAEGYWVVDYKDGAGFVRILVNGEPVKSTADDAIPGGGAEIFDEELRAKICPEKGSTREWFEVHDAAHRLGLKSNATILYGHVESIEQRIDHLNRLREQQDRTGGFDAFIPLKYRNFGNSMSEIGEVSIIEDLKMLALSRIFLDNFPHIKAYWVMYGKSTTELALQFGADDVDGTIDDTTKIYSMAGAVDQKPRMTIDEIERMAKDAGLEAVERDTFYNELKREK